MEYDPIKDLIGGQFSRRPFLQRLFFWLLDRFFLRSWHVRQLLGSHWSDTGRSNPKRILDAGTGFGQYVRFLAHRFADAEIVAVDVKQDYLDNAERYFNTTSYADRLTWANADLTAFQLDKPVDLILSVDVMEHIEDDRAVFRCFYQNLNPGGHVVVNTPSDLGGSGVTEEGDRSFIGEHVRDGYPLSELTEKLETAGLSVVDSRYTYGFYGSVAWRLLIQIPMKLINVSRWFIPVVCLYYIPVFPLGMLLNWIDVSVSNSEGTGLLVTARKR